MSGKNKKAREDEKKRGEKTSTHTHARIHTRAKKQKSADAYRHEMRKPENYKKNS